jgi:ssRNA-specific RNase YbeY (16S rRNA maturation enzyme)
MRVIAHGVLHLIGYKDMDQESKGKMREKENFFLNFLDSLQDEKHV